MIVRGHIDLQVDLLGNVTAAFQTTDQSGAIASGPVSFGGALSVLAIAFPTEVKALLTPTTTTTTTNAGTTTTTVSPSISVQLGLLR